MKKITVYTVGCTVDGKEGIVLIHHNKNECIDMLECELMDARAPMTKVWISFEDMDTRTYVNQNRDNLTKDEIKELLA